MIEEITDIAAIPALKQIWKDGFHDEDEYIHTFLMKNWKQMRIICYTLEGIPVCAAYLLPAFYRKNNSSPTELYYIYAAATAEKNRNKGYFTALLSWISQNIERPFFLVPENRSLKHYYLRRGMRLWQKKSTKLVNYHSISPNMPIFVLRELNATEYGILRAEYFGEKGLIAWDESILQYILEENAMGNGFCTQLIYNGEQVIALGYAHEWSLRIQEIFATDRALIEPAIQHLLIQYNCSLAQLTITPPVMVSSNFPKTITGGYFNLTMGY